jgi:hypothetical protein
MNKLEYGAEKGEGHDIWKRHVFGNNPPAAAER